MFTIPFMTKCWSSLIVFGLICGARLSFRPWNLASTRGNIFGIRSPAFQWMMFAFDGISLISVLKTKRASGAHAGEVLRFSSQQALAGAILIEKASPSLKERVLASYAVNTLMVFQQLFGVRCYIVRGVYFPLANLCIYC